MSLAIPDYWRQFRDVSGLTGIAVEIPEEDDLSGLGADIEFFDDKSILGEANELFPGIVVQKDGYLPVGGCQIGSGDQFFIRVTDGVGGGLYQIYHDMVFDDSYDREEAVALVLHDYRDILRFVVVP